MVFGSSHLTILKQVVPEHRRFQPPWNHLEIEVNANH